MRTRRSLRGGGTELGDHLDGHRAELTGYCSRMLGSRVEAEDAVQETLIRAWRGIDRFEGRAALRTWLYGIATNVCFDHLRSGTQRVQPIDFGPAGLGDALQGPAAPAAGGSTLEPVDPADVAVAREETRRAFVAALRRLPPRQRAVLFLREVLRWRAREVADLLGVTVASVNSALQRARAKLAAGKDDDEGRTSSFDEADRALLARLVDAFARHDFDAIVAVLSEDVTQSRRPHHVLKQSRDNSCARSCRLPSASPERS